VLPWVERHARDRFFLYVQSMDVHPPYVLPARDGSGDLRAQYDAAVTFNDREIARLHQRLVDLGLASRTLFIVTADHGEAFGEHGQSGHGLSVYDEEVRVPLLLHWPGRIAPGWVEEPVSLVDLLPTILDYAGIAFEEGMFQGRSLMRLDASAVPRPVFSRRFVYPEDLDAAGGGRHESRAVVMYPWKLTATDTSDDGRRLELFDLEADPREGRDASASEQARVRSMETVLQSFLDEQRHARARFLAASARGTAAQTPRRQLPDNVLQQLRSLGYIK
jgi:arylsulfatase A-like enzyme